MGFSQRLGLSRYEADLFYSEALDHYQKEDYKAAIDAISQAITLLPLNSEYQATRGLFYMEKGNKKEARANYEAALKLHEGEVLANYGMGVLAFEDKDWDAARAWFAKARAVNPTQVEVPYYIALTYHREQDNTTAKTYMELALQLMEDANDKRKTVARRWIKEFEKLIKQAQYPDEPEPVQKELPLDGEALGVRVSREELADNKKAGLLGGGETGDDSGK